MTMLLAVFTAFLLSPVKSYLNTSLMVPMRDGVGLLTRIYLPEPFLFSPPFPTMYEKTPYNVDDMEHEEAMSDLSLSVSSLPFTCFITTGISLPWVMLSWVKTCEDEKAVEETIPFGEPQVYPLHSPQQTKKQRALSPNRQRYLGYNHMVESQQLLGW